MHGYLFAWVVSVANQKISLGVSLIDPSNGDVATLMFDLAACYYF